MDGAAFQGMPRIALTPAEEAQIPRPHSSASQVATALPSAYTRASPSRHLYHPYYNNPSAGSLAGFGSPSSPKPGDIGYSRPSSPGPRPISPSPSSIHHHHYNTYPPNNNHTNNAPVEQEYPQNPQNSYAYYSQVPPRSSSPGPSRLAFSLTPRARTPSPQLHSNLHHPSSYFHRPSYDYSHPRPGSPLQQEHQDSRDSIQESPTPYTDSNGESGDDSDDEQDEPIESPRRRRPETKRSPSSKGILSRLKERTSRLSFGDEVLRHQHQLHQQQQQDKEKRSSQDSDVVRRSSQDSSASRRPKEVLHDLSDEEKQGESRKSTSRWRPSLSLIRQESSSSNNGSQYLQNNPHRISNNDHEEGGHKKKKARKGKNGKRKRKGQKRTRKPRQDDPHSAYVSQGMYAPPVLNLSLPSLGQVLDKKTRYPLRYEDFEEFLRSQRAVEYLNFWADVTAHEQLCRTFDVSERRQKREQQLEERALARDRRRMALAAIEAGRFTPDPGHTSGAIVVPEDSNMYQASRSSLQLPLNDHLSFPQESRRYGVQDSSAPFPPSHSGNSINQYTAGAYNRMLGGGRRESGEVTRPSLEDANISEQDAAVAAVAMRAQRNGLGPCNDIREGDRRGSFDLYRPLPGTSASLRYQQNNASNGHIGPNFPLGSHSSPIAYNLMMRGRGSVDVMARSNSRSSRTRPSGSEDYFGNGMRRTSSQQFNYHTQHSPPQPPAQIEEGQDHTGRQEDTAASELMPLDRRPSVARFGSGVGPLQSPVNIVRRSGESGYAPSIFSNGQERGLLVQSFRAIGLEDLQESALRIYRKYLIQLRTASMAAEEEAAASALREGHPGNRKNRNSLEKPIATGWDGYAEEVIAQWNENWKGRSREARRSRRLSGRTVPARGVSGASTTPGSARDENSGPRSVAGDEESQAGGVGNEGWHHKGLSINTHRSGSNEKVSAGHDDDEDHSDQEDVDSENEKGRRGGKASIPTSPLSPKVRKRTGTGLSAILSPFLTRLMRTETTVVELPTLTINTTTVEEATVLAETDDDDDDEYDTEEDEDSDDEEEESESEVEISRPKPAVVQKQPTITKESQDESVIVVLNRSLPSSPPPPPGGAESNQSQRGHAVISRNSDLQQAIAASVETPTATAIGSPQDDVSSEILGGVKRARRGSSASSLSSSWDRITKRDLEKGVTILPNPVTMSSSRPFPYRRPGAMQGVRSRTGKAATVASRAALKVGWHLTSLLTKARPDSGSSSSLDTIQVTPVTPRVGGVPLDFKFNIPSIIATQSSPGSDEEKKRQQGGFTEPGASTSPQDLLRPRSWTDPGIVRSQEGSFAHQAGLAPPQVSSTTNHGAFQDALSPALSSAGATHQPISASPSGSPTPSGSPIPSSGPVANVEHHPSVSSPAAVAASAAAAAFYLPLECRQRIHTQVQEEGRTEAPYLFGPAKGFVMDVVLQDHYYPMFLKYVEHQNLGLLNKHHPNNQIKRKGVLWIGISVWLVVLGIQLTLVLLGLGGWGSPWVWIVGTAGGWTGSVCLSTGISGFSPILGIVGKMSEDKHVFRFRRILEPSIRVRHRRRAYWVLTYCVFWSTVVMVAFAALPQRHPERTMKNNTKKRRAGSPYDTSSSKAANHSKTNDSDDEKAVVFSKLYHPHLTHPVNKNSIHAESWGKGEHHRPAQEPLEKDNIGPLAEETSREANSHGRFHSTQPPRPTSTPTPTSVQPSTHASRGSYCQDAKAQPPMHPLQEHDKNHMVEKKCNFNTYPHNPSAQQTPKTSASVPTAPHASDAIYIQSSSHDPSAPVYPPVNVFGKPLQRHQSPTTPSHILVHTPSPPPPPDKEESPWGSKIPSTHSSTHLYSPPATAQEEPHARFAKSVPAYDVNYPRGYPHLSWPESFEPNRFRNNLSAAVDLNELEVAPWCGTDLVGDPSMFFTHRAQARADDARHKRVEKWSLEEQRMRTQWHPQRYLRRPTRGQSIGGTTGVNAKRGAGRLRRQGQSQSQGQGGYADYGLLDQSDEVRAAAKWVFEVESSGEEGRNPIQIPIQDTSARLVDMMVSREQAEEEALFLPPVRDKYVRKAEEKTEGNMLQFLFSTFFDELGFSGEKEKEKGKK
ncbi:hypothetical protein BG006_002351 [Podila minutissima]|uniref:RGS domain-containing protein n=1 Tax=Podila minutissima TaxID=64525 RepID=A0A9P5VNQ8_9FUNG|nr:hypothetical protein BG006_002351 [Podila minutissima]